MSKPTTLAEVAETLRAHFPDNLLNYRTGSTWDSNGRKVGRPVAYIKADSVMDFLDDLVGPEGWESRLVPTGTPGAYICELTILGVTKSAIGQAGKDEGEKEKSGDSDAFKRAAVMFGIGRYLRRLDLPPVDLVQRGDKWDLPRDWRPGSTAPAGRNMSHRRDANVTQNTTPSASAGDDGLRAHSRYKLYESKVNALKARARDVVGWEVDTLEKAVAKWYGAPSLEDLTATEFAELMDTKLAAAAEAIKAKQPA